MLINEFLRNRIITMPTSVLPEIGVKDVFFMRFELKVTNATFGLFMFSLTNCNVLIKLVVNHCFLTVLTKTLMRYHVGFNLTGWEWLVTNRTCFVVTGIVQNEQLF